MKPLATLICLAAMWLSVGNAAAEPTDRPISPAWAAALKNQPARPLRPAAAAATTSATLPELAIADAPTSAPGIGLTIKPGVGVGDLKFRVQADDVTRLLGEPVLMTYGYTNIGMFVVVSPKIGVYSISFGDMGNPQSPFVKACKFKTDAGIGMGSKLGDLKKAYGEPSSVQAAGATQKVVYDRLGATFTLAGDAVIHMTFRPLRRARAAAPAGTKK